MSTDIDHLVTESLRLRRQMEDLAANPANKIRSDPDSLEHLWNMADLALVLMQDNGLRPGESGGWTLEWERSPFAAGHCYPRERKLTLSAPLFAIWTFEDCQETILHEIAHALVPAQKGAIHTPEWQRKCVEIGGDGSTTWGHEGEARVAEHTRQTPRYRGTCGCGYAHTRVRPPKPGIYRCNLCGGVVTYIPI